MKLKKLNHKNQSNNNAEDDLRIKLEKEVGDVFFAMVNYARFLRNKSEDALRLTNEKFHKKI